MIDNKYKKVYDTLINNAVQQLREKTEDTVYERHHIVPRSLGGTNDPQNLVLLTPKEHYICHHLLTKFTNGPARHKMMLAYKMMLRKSRSNTRGFRITARMYERAKHYQSEVSKSRVHSVDVKKKISKGCRDWHSDPCNKEKFKQARVNQSITDAHRENWSKKSKEYWDNLTEEQRAEVSRSRSGKNNANYGNRLSEEAKARISAANKGNQHHKGKKQNLRTCPHCGKQGGNAMTRWHFDNCKFK